MADNRGGYRKPNNPAPVSGPGKFSRRTDGGPMDTQPQRYMQGQAYGESKELNELQSGAPLAAAPSNVPSISSGLPKPPNVSLSAPSTYPDQMVTEGLETDMGKPPTSPEDRQKIAVMLALADRAAQDPNASPATVNFVRRLRGLI
jgi:hypothetical protein